MNIRVKLEIAKILNLEFELSSSKKKEEQSNAKEESTAATANKQ